MVESVIFDADGVLVNKPAVFSACLARDYNIPLEKIVPFFQNEFKPCLTGKADLKEVVKKYLPEWGWQGSVEDLLDYWFRIEHHVDDRLVASIKDIRSRGIPCYLATVQEKYRTAYMKEQMGFGQIFDGVYSSADFGYRKQDQEFWHSLGNAIHLKDKSKVIFWDDDMEAINGAREFGIMAYQYTDFPGYEKTMEELLR